MGLHTIAREVQVPDLSQRIKDGIAYFLFYYNGDFSIVVSRTPTERGHYIWYYNPTDKVLNALSDTDIGYWQDDYNSRTDIHTTFDWNDISIINNSSDTYIVKRYTRHD